ncbi:unnamed protein product [Thelazia callipaeda]|uniref:DDHD domain-containing protein n=1 Tax=Thelazia callipaeda TaxID=103827 RepID=A0A158RBJ7_THECL|nr:unnamed protein product [Thelazia callipaeda]
MQKTPLFYFHYSSGKLHLFANKKSRQESLGEGSGIEIITNEPYSDGPGGSGQYTFKIYHIGKKIPVWLRSVLPTNALEAHEEAWNAYPYTKTRYSSPFLDRFNIEVETKYYNDAGIQDNIFELTKDELKNRIVDKMDFVNDSISAYDYIPEEDPKLYHSIKTGRGPLKADWIDDCVKNGKPIMCAYKLCKVEFRFWGLQTRAERWIHNYALRNTMLRAHKQAWAWQDEWHNLTLDDIRKLEQDVAEHLSKVMARSLLSVSSSIYFDCLENSAVSEGYNLPSLINWDSDTSLHDGHETPPETPQAEQNIKMSAVVPGISLLVIFLYTNIFPDTFDENVIDPNSLRLTIEKQIANIDVDIRRRVHFLQICCGQEFADIASRLISVSPSYGFVHPTSALLFSSSHYYEKWDSLAFQPDLIFLLGCPLAYLLIQRKFYGYETKSLRCNQLFNLYYSLDACGARLEPVLNPQLTMLLPVNVPRFNDFTTADKDCDSIINSSLLWSNQRIDQILHCPYGIPLPKLLHASYWESDDVAAFILRQFFNSEKVSPGKFGDTTAFPLEVNLNPPVWNKKRTKYKIANLSPNYSGNDVICIEGMEQVIHARFCYGPMDLVALSREYISAYVRPFGGDWQLIKTDMTDSHGKIAFQACLAALIFLGNKLPIGAHCVKSIVHGDHSFLDLFLVVAPVGEEFVVFSVDGSLTSSMSVTGRDPRVRPGAVDVVRYWHDLGYTIIYITARPDMQHRVVALWLTLHNFPQGLLIFTPSFSTDPLKQKVLHLKSYLDMGLHITAAYGSSKDVSVYNNAGMKSERIFSVTGGKRSCTNIDSYASHLKSLNEGMFDFAKPFDSSLIFPYPSPMGRNNRRNIMQRNHSFTPRSGRQLSDNI